MKICHTCQRTYSDDLEFCPRDGSRLAAQAAGTEAELAVGLSRRFRIVRRLGAGGMGTVFLAEQVGVGNRPVALKVLNRRVLDDPDFLLRFQNEAGSTGRIRHSNVVTIYESAQADDGTPYIAMEFLEGESLRETLKRRGALPLPEVAEILNQAARGLNAAHRLGIIHRDLKPDNIFLTHSDDDSLAPMSLPANSSEYPPANAAVPPPAGLLVKIVDFGIAKLRESSTQTTTGMVLGTPQYMSYEQASGMRSDELDARSDVYSLGVVVYEMLSGRLPFHSDTPLGYLRKHMMETPPPFRAVAPGLALHPAVEMAVLKALAKDRDERHSSVLDFAHAVSDAGQPTVQMRTTTPLPPAQVVPLRAAEEAGQPLRSVNIVPPVALKEVAVTSPLPASAQAKTGTAVATPPSTPSPRVADSPSVQTVGSPAAVAEITPKLAPGEVRPAAGNWAVRAARAMVRSVQPQFSLSSGAILVLLTLFLPIGYQSCGPKRTGFELAAGQTGSLMIGQISGGWFDRCFYIFTLLLAIVTLTLVVVSLARNGALGRRSVIDALFGLAGAVSLTLLGGAVVTGVFIAAIIIPHAQTAVRSGVIPGIGIVVLALALRNRALRSSKAVLLVLVLGCLACLLLLTNLVVSLSMSSGYLPSSFTDALEIFVILLYGCIPIYVWLRRRIFGSPRELEPWLEIRGGIVKLYLPCILGVPFMFWVAAAEHVWGLIPYAIGNHLISLGYMQLASRPAERDAPEKH